MIISIFAIKSRFNDNLSFCVLYANILRLNPDLLIIARLIFFLVKAFDKKCLDRKIQRKSRSKRISHENISDTITSRKG